VGAEIGSGEVVGGGRLGKTRWGPLGAGMGAGPARLRGETRGRKTLQAFGGLVDEQRDQSPGASAPDALHVP
jgi:hypothetical protein